MRPMWMIRAEGGQYYDDFREREVAAIGWHELAARVRPGMSRTALIELYLGLSPQSKKGTIIAGASQVWRFLNEIEPGDHVVTYSPSNRTYMIGTFTGPASHHAEWQDAHMSLARPVTWKEREISRDDLSLPTRNSLGSTLTVFRLPEHATQELLGDAPSQSTDTTVIGSNDDDSLADPLEDIESVALERIKDMVSALDWSDMQDLVAGILRAMGYKTQISPAGPDRGKDVIASPDGFGFENPRIVVEVKHRSGSMGSQAIRSFLGGRHKDDRGLYVSTGGFSRDAHYEAERASVPLALWSLDNLVRALVEHYDHTDAETKRLVPLKRLHWPA